MAINYFGEARMKQLLTLIKGQLDLKATPEQIAQAITDANLAQYAKAADLTAAVARIGENETDIAAIQKALESVATTEGLATLTADVNTIKGDYLKAADKAELQTAITNAVKAHDESDAAHAALFKALNDKDTAMQGEIDALEGKVGTVPTDKTVVQMISEAQAAATYDDEEVRGLIQDNADAIDTLNGTGEGSVDKKITDAFNDFSTKVTDDAVVNSYKELIDWAATHGAEAAEMAGAITALENILAGIGGEGEHATVVAHVNAAIEALKIGDYAKASELTALAERVAAMEAKVTDWDDAVAKEHEHANKAELDLIASGDKAKWDAAEQNAKDYADGLNTAMDTRVKAVEGKAHEHGNKTVLDGITAEMVSAWNEADIEYTEAEVTAMWNEVFNA